MSPRNAVDTALATDSESARTAAERVLVLGAMLYVLVFVVSAVAGYFEQLVLWRMGIRIVCALKERVFGHLLAHSTTFHDANGTAI